MSPVAQKHIIFNERVTSQLGNNGYVRNNLYWCKSNVQTIGRFPASIIRSQVYSSQIFGVFVSFSKTVKALDEPIVYITEM